MNENVVIPLLILALGTMLSVIGFLIVFVLKGIKGEIRDIKVQLSKIEDDLHKRVSEIDRRHQDVMVEHDRRISKIEARCDVTHGGTQ